MSQVRLIVFDLGGVIVRINHGWEQACKYAGVPRPAVFDDPQGFESLVQVGIRFETGRCDEAAFLADVAALASWTVDQARRVLHHWLIAPYPGAAELIEEASTGLSVPTACLSNTNATHWAMMHGDSHAAVPLHRLAHRFASHLIGAMKPDEAIYRHVEEATRLPAESILFFDDHGPNVQSARRRGWQVEQIDPAGDTVGQIRRHLRQRGFNLK